MKTALTALTFLAAAFTISTANARVPFEECSADSDCPESFVCVTEEYGACPPCIPGEDCGTCSSDSYSYCSPPPPEQCNSDADCTGGFVCVSYTYEACSGWDLTCAVSPDGDESCDVPDPGEFECESHSEAYCVPPYFAPCQVDADCGGGFTCETVEICECSGSGSIEPFPGDDGDGAPSPEPIDCVCAPSDTKYCELIYTTCDSNSDCASGLTCVQDAYIDYPTQSEDPTEPDGRSGDEPVASPSPTIESYCAPQGYWGTPTSSGNAEALPSSDAKSAERVNWGDHDGSSSGNKADGGGCTTANGNAPFGVLALFGLIALRLRRR